MRVWLAAMLLGSALLGGCRETRERDETFKTSAAAASTPASADLTGLAVSFTQHRTSAKGTDTLLVYEDGSLKLTSGERDAPVTKSTKVDPAKVRRLRDRVAAPPFVALPDEPAGGHAPYTYTIGVGSRRVHRSDPIGQVEPAFRDVLIELGPLSMEIDRAPP